MRWRAIVQPMAPLLAAAFPRECVDALCLAPRNSDQYSQNAMAMRSDCMQGCSCPLARNREEIRIIAHRVNFCNDLANVAGNDERMPREVVTALPSIARSKVDATILT